MDELAACYELFECHPEDSDIVFDERCNEVFDKYQGEKQIFDKLQQAYRNIKENRDDYVEPGDVKGEERNLKNIEHNLLMMQQKLKCGLKKIDCIEEVKNIKLCIYRIAPFWVDTTRKHLKNTGQWNYSGEQYLEFMRSFFEQKMEKRVFGSREDKVCGWLKNYNAQKGDFIHYARNTMSHIRSDLKQELYNISTKSLDGFDMERGSGNYKDISDEEAKKTNEMEKRRKEILEKYDVQELMLTLATGPQILKICEAVNALSQANEFARYYISNATLTFLKEVIPDGITSQLLEGILIKGIPEGIVPANAEDIYESLAIEFVDYIMVEECVDIDDIITFDLCNYQDIGVEKKGEIRFFKSGIKYIDDILVRYYATMKGEADKKSDSMKTIRTRHWKKFKNLILKEQKG